MGTGFSPVSDNREAVMSQQGSLSRYWLVVGLFLSLNTAGLVWIRHAWAPQRGATRLVTLDVTPGRTKDTRQATDDQRAVPAIESRDNVDVENAVPRTVVEPARIVAWLPVSNATSALTPENVLPDQAPDDWTKTPANFDGAERLLAVFDRPIVDEKELNRPLEQPPFRISPQVAGHWRWTSTSRLAFVLDQPLPAGRKFELTAAVDFAGQTHAELSAGSQRFQFVTRPLKWLGAALQTSSRDSVTFELTFNQPVDPGDLLRALVASDSAFPADEFVAPSPPPGRAPVRVQTPTRGGVFHEVDPFAPFDDASAIVPGGRAFDTTALTQEAASTPLQSAYVRVHRGLAFDATVLTKQAAAKLVVQTKRPSRSLRIALDATLTGHGAELALGAVHHRELDIPTAFAFVRREVNAVSFEDDVTVRLYFSSGLSADQEKPKVKVTPAVENLKIDFAPGHAGVNSYHAGLVVHGRFLCGRRYSLTLPQTIVSNDGQTLGETSPVFFDIPHRPADLKISGGQGILIPDGNLTLDVKCVNVDGVRMSASRLHANNLAAFLQGRGDVRTMRSLVQERMRSLDLKRDVPQTVALDLKQLLGVGKERRDDANDPSLPLTGIYQVSVADANEYWNRDTSTVSITDLGLTAKRGRDGWLVWVLSLRSAQPQAGVTVTARSFNNQVLAQAVTDASGIASLTIPENHPDGAAWLLTAERNGDLNYLLPDRHSWMIDNVDQSGRAWPAHYEAMLYTERGVYRPGDTVHLTGILRDRLGHRPPSFPLSIKVTRPDGRVIADLPCQPLADRQGMFHVDYPSSPTGQTGVYKFDVSIPGAKESLGSVSAQIEAFVPIRIAAEASPTQPRFVLEHPTINAKARYLFGQPASGLNVTATGTWHRSSFASKEHPDYQFGDFSGRNQQQLAEVQRTLGEDGTCEVPIEIPQDERPGLWAATVTTTVTETGGRSVSSTCRLETDTAGIHLGVKPPEKRVVAVDEAATFDWVILDGHGKPAAPRPIEMTLVRVDYDTTVAQVNGRPVWKTAERLIDVVSKPIGGDAPASSGSLGLICPVAGRYRLRLVDPESKSATQIEFHASTHRSDRVDVALQQPEQLDIVLDQSKYRPGDMARVLIRSPFSGQLLLTMEGDRVYDRRVVALDENSQLFEVPVPAELRGGAYVTATIIRAIDPQRTDWLPHRAFGMARLVVDPASNELQVKLEAANTALPGSTLKVRARVDWPASVEAPKNDPFATGFEIANLPNQIANPPKKSARVIHLWAVDEGILLTTRYVTPKPLEFFHKPRKLGVSSADVYSHLLPDHLRPASMTRIGADKGDGATSDNEVDGLRRGPVDFPRSTPAVIWQGVQPVSDDGSLTVDLPIPQLTGTLRLMAVAVHGDRYGSIEHRVTVTSPLLVESTWPRCAAPNDRFKVPVKLFNTTTAPLDVNVRAVVSGPVAVQFDGDARPEPLATVTVEPNQSLLTWLDVTAKGLGPATIRIEATSTAADGTSLSASTESGLAVRSATPLDSETSITRHPVGEPLSLAPLKGFLDGTTRTSITISSLPSADLTPALDALIDYPYGCGEQTSSRLYALIAAQNWLNSDKTASDKTPNVDSSRRKFIAQLIDVGVVRLWSMQNRNGGIGYWDHGPSQPWVSAYAAGAIVAARDAGQSIDPQFISDLAKYLESVLDGQAGDSATIDDNLRAYLCRILASVDKPKQGWMSRLSDSVESLDAEGRAHLAAAWIRLGRKDRAASVLRDDTFRLTAVASSSGRITSRIRQDAVLLQVLLELDPKHAAIPALVERLQSSRQKQTWMNTLENATAISALARYRASAPVASDFTGTLWHGDVEHSFSHSSPLHERWNGGSEALTITAQGKGEFYVVRTTEGLRDQQRIAPYDRQLKVRRQWLDRHDRAIDPTTLRVGDLVQVVIHVSSPDVRDWVPNVAIVDALPGGVEIENPRLSTSAQPDATNAMQADHVEFLDDRAVLFTKVGAGPQVFRYSVRVTTPGRFEWPPIQASSMYDPAFASVHGGGHVVVFGRDEVIHDVAERPGENATNRD